MSACAQTTTDRAWSTTWGTSPEYTGPADMPKTTLAGKTLRMVVHPTIAGDSIRLRLSNFHSDEPVEIKSVYIAANVDTVIKDQKTGRTITNYGCTPNIVKETARYLTFDGSKSVTIGAHANVTSDAIKFNFKGHTNLAITIAYGNNVPEHATSHRGSRTTSYIAEGTVNPEDDFKSIEKVDHWYNILSLDVNVQRPVVAVLGNSITDGRGTTTNAQNRWSDQMGKQGGWGVVNLGIGGNCVLRGGLSQPLMERYRDELSFHTGITHLIIFEGTNDIGTSSLPSDSLANELIAAYKDIISYAHSKGMKVFMATITPTKGNNWYSSAHEQTRQLVNKWIRQKDGFENVIDFDELVRDPHDNERLRTEYSDDWLHLNPLGYEAMGSLAAKVLSSD